MKLEYRDGLIFTKIELTYNNKTKTLDNIVLDTGATKSLILQEVVDDIGIRVSKEDKIVMSYGIGGKEPAFIKEIDKIMIGNFIHKNVSIDFSRIDYEDINGLLGLDLLMEGGFIIDLNQMEMKTE